MAVLEYRVNEIDNEARRTRDRLHLLESDRATLRLVVEQMEKLVASMETIAKRVARETVAQMLEARAVASRDWREHVIHMAQLGVALLGAWFLFH